MEPGRNQDKIRDKTGIKPGRRNETGHNWDEKLGQNQDETGPNQDETGTKSDRDKNKTEYMMI